MDELTPIQAMILQIVEGAFRTQGALSAHSVLQVANMTSALPHDVITKWTYFIVMAYDAEQARFDDRRAAELNHIIDGTAYDAEMQEWHDTQDSLEASVRA